MWKKISIYFLFFSSNIFHILKYLRYLLLSRIFNSDFNKNIFNIYRKFERNIGELSPVIDLFSSFFRSFFIIIIVIIVFFKEERTKEYIYICIRKQTEYTACTDSFHLFSFFFLVLFFRCAISIRFWFRNSCFYFR